MILTEIYFLEFINFLSTSLSLHTYFLYHHNTSSNPCFKLFVIPFALTSTSKKITIPYQSHIQCYSILSPLSILLISVLHFKLDYFSKNHLLTIIQDSTLSPLLPIYYIVSI